MATVRITIDKKISLLAIKRNPEAARLGLPYLVNLLLCRHMGIADPLPPNEIKRLEALKREATKRAANRKAKRLAKSESEFQDAESRGQVRLFALKPTKRIRKQSNQPVESLVEVFKKEKK